MPMSTVRPPLTRPRTVPVTRVFSLAAFSIDVPYAVPLGFVVAQQEAAFGLFALDDHFNRVAGLQLGLTGVVQHLLERNQAFGLQTDIDTTCLSVSLITVPDMTMLSSKRLGCCFSSLLAIKGLERGGKIFHQLPVSGRLRLQGMGTGSDATATGCCGFLAVFRKWLPGCGLVSMDGSDMLRRCFQRWGFKFGVQRIALGLFRI